VLITTRVEAGQRLPMVVWQFADPMTVASTAACGGGLGDRRWIINAQVGSDYARRDQGEHGAELAAAAGLEHANGVVMFTAADVRGVRSRQDGGVCADATVGLTHPGWAAAPDAPAPPTLGTINIVAVVPARLTTAALLNAPCTATEAKAQALLAAGVPATGTPSDAVTVACSGAGPAEPFGGPRSIWGARLARAVHGAVLAGAGP
jgi:adenosylcobinamide hydrolase